MRVVAGAEQQPGGALGGVIRSEMKARGWGWPDIDRHSGPGGMSSGTLRQIATGRSRASRQMLKRIGELFEVDYTQWDEWRLAQARHLLDERDPPDGVGRDQALANLARIRRALGI